MIPSLDLTSRRLLMRELFEGFSPRTAIILGSGLGYLSEAMQVRKRVSYADIPLLPTAQVAGHAGELLIGSLYDVPVLVFCGRFHVYQGLTAFEATEPVRLAAAAGCNSLLLTCAVGGLRTDLQTGDFLLVKDHLNLSGLTPLHGISPPPFVDLGDCYRYEFLPELTTLLKDKDISIQSGTLAYMPGPNYETPAEVKSLRLLGADVVGMSAAIEAIMARALNLEVSCLALVTNSAGGGGQVPLNHQEVLQASRAASSVLPALVESTLHSLALENHCKNNKK